MKKDKNLVWQRVDPEDLSGLRVAIVGGTGGIGRAFSRLLASRGANVVVVGQTFRDAGTPGIEFVQADLSLMGQARRVAEELPAETLDLVVFTTGIFAAPTRQETAEGIEKDMAVSYLSRLVILRQIAPRLGRDRPSAKMAPRVFVMGFPGSGQSGTLGDLNAETAYRSMTVHMNTVAGNEMLVLDAAERHPHLDVFGLNPGLIKSNIRSNVLGDSTLRHRLAEGLIGLITPSAETYARRILPLLVSPDLAGHSGAMFDRKGDAVAASPKLTGSQVRAFLAESESLVAKTGIRLDVI